MMEYLPREFIFKLLWGFVIAVAVGLLIGTVIASAKNNSESQVQFFRLPQEEAELRIRRIAVIDKLFYTHTLVGQEVESCVLDAWYGATELGWTSEGGLGNNGVSNKNLSKEPSYMTVFVIVDERFDLHYIHVMMLGDQLLLLPISNTKHFDASYSDQRTVHYAAVPRVTDSKIMFRCAEMFLAEQMG